MIKFNFDFGDGPERDGSVRVRKTDVFCPDKGYGFLGVSRESAELPKVIDGYYQDGRHLTVLSEREGGVFVGYGMTGMEFLDMEVPAMDPLKTAADIPCVLR